MNEPKKCKFYDEKRNECTALKLIFCKNERCNFFKEKEEEEEKQKLHRCNRNEAKWTS